MPYRDRVPEAAHVEEMKGRDIEHALRKRLSMMECSFLSLGLARGFGSEIHWGDSISMQTLIIMEMW